MDAVWSTSSPWNDDNDQHTHNRISAQEDDPWATTLTTAQDGHRADFADVQTLDTGFRTLSTNVQTATPWGSSDVEEDTSQPRVAETISDVEEEEGTRATHLSSATEDPWAANESATAWSAHPVPSATSDGWTVAEDTWAADVVQTGSTARDVDEHVWPSSSHTPQLINSTTRSTQMERDQIDSLKLDARDLVTTVHTDPDGFASTFSNQFDSAEGFGDLFGSEGDKRELKVRLDTPPAVLLASDGVSLNLGTAGALWSNSPVTQHKFTLAVQNTENRAVKLTAPDTSAAALSWRSASGVKSSSDWTPSVDAGVRLSIDGPRSSVDSSSGPGWSQTSAANDSTAKSGAGSFIASFFKTRQPQQAATVTASNMRKTSSQISRNSHDLAPSPQGRPSMEDNMSVGAFRDETDSTLRYSDDPTGPDLMNMHHEQPTIASPPSTSATPASFLGRWRASGMFQKAAAPTDANANTGWTRSFSKTGLRNNLYDVDDDDKQPSRSYYDDEETEAQPSRYDEALSDNDRDSAPDPTFSQNSSTKYKDDDFGGLWDTPLPAPQTPVQSNSGTHFNFDGTLMSTPSLLSTKPKRASLLPPPPRSSTAKTSAPSTAFQDLLFDDFEPSTAAAPHPAPAPKQQSSYLSQKPAFPPAAPKPTTHGRTASAGLTADDLLFFDNF